MSNDPTFTGSVPANYDEFLVPLIFEAYAADLASRVPNIPGNRVLEIAAGTGVVTRHLRRELPDSSAITATDLNGAMLEVAQQRSTGSDITYMPADACQLPFDNDKFDTVVCQFGIMFFPDKAKALQETLRVLKPGGKYVFNVWDTYEENELVRIVNNALTELLPEDSPKFFDTPYGECDTEHYRQQLSNAGFEQITTEVISKRSQAASARDVIKGYVYGSPVRAEIEAQRPDGIDAIASDVEDVLVARFGESNIDAKMQAVIFSAACPS